MKRISLPVPVTKSLLSRVVSFFFLVVFLGGQFGATASAVVTTQPFTQPQLFQSGVGYFNVNCDATGGADGAGAPTGGGPIDITDIVSKYKLQSVMIQEVNGGVVARSRANTPPATPASTMKLIIADVVLRNGINLNKTVSVGSDVYYDGDNDLDKSQVTLGEALREMLRVSSNVGANVLMKALGGVTAFTQKAQGYGYKHTTVAGYYDPSNDGKNISTISDQVSAMNHIFSTNSSKYKDAQDDLKSAAQNDNYYNVDDVANKWAGTSTVAGNVGLFRINDTGYIIGLYYNGSDASSEAKKAVKDGSADLARLIESNGSSSVDTSSCTCTSSASDDSALAGSDNEEKTWNFFKGKGLSDEQTAGVMGNIDNESGFNPQAVEGGGNSKTQPKTGGADGWGLAQWTYPYQEVDELVQEYKKSKYTDPKTHQPYDLSGHLYDLKTQLNLIWAQMNETSPTGVNNMVGGLKHINDVSQAATYFSDNFEGGIPGSRIADALDAYAKYKDGGGGGGSEGGSATITTSDTLNGHKLPATVGGTGLESLFSSYALGTPADEDENNYYITMRWRYAKWNWDGTSVSGPEDVGFYQKHPKVLVTNPRNHKSIIADALESGPAPWTGVDSGPNNNPKQGWTNPQNGTPPSYKGRVSGFPPPGFQALGAIQTTPGTGDKLQYAWAPDQNAKLGPTNLSVNNINQSDSCSSVGSASNTDIVRIAKQELALGLEGKGHLNDGGPVCKYQGSGCPQAWCADFVSWVYKAAGAPFTGGADGGWRLALASDTTGYFLSRKSRPDIGYGTPSGGDKIEPGWVVSFPGVDAGVRGIGHVGIVTAVHGNTFDDIEGNGSGSGVSENKNIQISSAIDWGGYK